MGDLHNDLFAVQYYSHKLCEGHHNAAASRCEATRTQQAIKTPWKRTWARQLVPRSWRPQLHLPSRVSQRESSESILRKMIVFFHTWYIVDILYLLS